MSKNFTVENERAITVRGLVMVTDPCYFIRDQDWQDLCADWFPDGHGRAETADACVVKYKGARILVGRTAYGDGEYRVEGAGTFGVDAGVMCVVQVDELEAAGLTRVDSGSATYLDVGPNPVVVWTDGKGQFGGAIRVDTVGGDEDEDDGDGR